jgi:hypothetical protein
LRREHTEVARTDFFDSPAGAQLASRFARIEQALSPAHPEDAPAMHASLSAYRNKRWVTRPSPHVDRLACAWLIRRFINPRALIRYSSTPQPEEVPFDMSHGPFSHHGNLCTFEIMMRMFGLDEAAMAAMAQIVHEIDLRDGRYIRPEVPGIDAVLRGWSSRSDAERELHGIALFDGLYAALSRTASPARSARKRRASTGSRRSAKQTVRLRTGGRGATMLR